MKARRHRRRLVELWRSEREAARAARRAKDGEGEWRHLERAHIVSQRAAGLHVRTHLAMGGFAIRRRDARELGGQVVRLLLAAPGSWTRRYPRDNTGGSNVSAFRPMPIPSDLQAALHEAPAPASPR